MLQIEFKSHKAMKPLYAGGREYEIETQYLIVNGVEDKEWEVYQVRPLPSCTIKNDTVLRILLQSKFDEVGQYFSTVYFTLTFDYWEAPTQVAIEFGDNNSFDDYEMRLTTSFEKMDLWNKPYSMADWVNEFKNMLSNEGDVSYEYTQVSDENVAYGFGLKRKPYSTEQVIQGALTNSTDLFNIAMGQTSLKFQWSGIEHSLFTNYSFPPEIRTACSQYLIYFTQFMADLGIDVDTEVKSEIEKTLFKVTPKDKTESLEKIREALDIYLNSPLQKDFFQTAAVESNLAVKQWESQVYFLKSQLTLAETTIQAKQSVIGMFQITNYELEQKFLAKEQKPVSEPETVMWGLITLKKFDGKAVEVDLPELYRRMKRIVFK